MRARFLRLRRWVGARRGRLLACALAAGALLLNVAAYLHARAFTHFGGEAEVTGRPEDLSRFERVRVLLTGVSLPRPRNTSTPADFGLPYATHRLAASDGVELEAWHVPRAAPRGIVVLAHGYAASMEDVLPLARAWHDLGFEAVLVDLRGGGGSCGTTTTLGVEEGRDVAAAADLASRLAGRPPVLYGVSMGAAAVLRAVHAHGVQPAGVVLECPFDTLLHTVERRFGLMGLPAFPAAHLLVLWGGVQHGFDGFAHRPVDYAASVRCPALLLHGEADERVSVDEVRAVRERLAGPSTLVTFAGVGHEAYPRGAWTAAVTAFLRDLPAR